MINAAAAVGYRVMIDQTGDDHERERRLLTGADRTMLFDGILFSPLVTATELLEMRAGRSIPLVLLGEHDFDGRYDHVAIDNERAAYDATAHLVSLGRRRIAAIGAQPQEDYATPASGPPATRTRCATPASSRTPTCCARRRGTAGPTATPPPRRCWPAPTGRTRSSATRT